MIEPKKVYLQVAVEVEKQRRLKSICALTGRKMNEVVAELIDVFIDAVEKENES